MTSTRSGINYSVQSNGFGPENSSHEYKGQDRWPRGEAQIEDAKTSTSFQRLSGNFDTLIESPESDVTDIPVIGSEQLPTGSSRDIPVLIQELVYCSKEAGVGTFSQIVNRDNKLLPSIE
ncbi:hypothetical protein O181_091750 [Austropuccinia psidii MF-1]|uniref:Uncharacterized protein n=1 Tax=Austropuccinia psidii MF-1 TaxID=1389203 RepID=A0A9Q3P8F4_9BASI|nr:hypothetical protein [Austropuccinia psidii MF-1]